LSGTAPPQIVREATLDDAGAAAELLGQLGYPVSASEARTRLARGGEHGTGNYRERTRAELLRRRP
jgi:hypothetical protein